MPNDAKSVTWSDWCAECPTPRQCKSLAICQREITYYGREFDDFESDLSPEPRRTFRGWLEGTNPPRDPANGWTFGVYDATGLPDDLLRKYIRGELELPPE